ncbi:MAG: DUF2760 domain-containing protein, partial [Thermoguttaceae bacterium]
MSISTAFKAFFAALFNKNAAQRIAEVLDNTNRLSFEEERQRNLLTVAEQDANQQEDTTQTSYVPLQNEAITLLAAMQREARFVDFIQESLTGYSDSQIGAAARKVHDDCAKVLNRFFDFKPVIDLPEESKIEITRDELPKYQL